MSSFSVQPRASFRTEDAGTDAASDAVVDRVAEDRRDEQQDHHHPDVQPARWPQERRRRTAASRPAGTGVTTSPVSAKMIAKSEPVNELAVSGDERSQVFVNVEEYVDDFAHAVTGKCASAVKPGGNTLRCDGPGETRY